VTITFVGSIHDEGIALGATTRNFGGGNIAATVAGDLLIAAISNGAPANEVDPITPPDAGWHRVRRDITTDAFLVAQLWYKIATGPNDGGGIWTFGTIAGCAETVAMDTVAYHTTGGPWALGNTGANITEDFVAGAGNTENIVAPSVTADARVGQLVLCNFVSTDIGGSLSSTLALPGSLTQRYNDHTNSTQEGNGDDFTIGPSSPSGARTAVLTIVGAARTTDQIGQSVIFGTDTAVSIEQLMASDSTWAPDWFEPESLDDYAYYAHDLSVPPPPNVPGYAHISGADGGIKP
jgi:hypothetical protein